MLVFGTQNKRRKWMRRRGFGLAVLATAILFCLVVGCQQAEEKSGSERKTDDKLDVDKIPGKVMDALKARFPEAKISKWTREEESELVVYDIEFEQAGRKFEADIKEDGAIHNWEKAIQAEDLPEIVKKSVLERYAQSTITEIMEISAVQDGKDVLLGYEIVIETADKNVFELTVAPEGEILEDSGKKPEEK
jgi:uncharacterized membrane protein YkoI